MKHLFYKLSILFLIVFQATSMSAQVMLDLETGAVFSGYNNVRIPGNLGTNFSLKNDLKPQVTPFYRLRGSYVIKKRHSFSVLYAPLKIKSEGNVAKDIFFQGVLFPANTDLKGTYQFNSYRLTYRYDIISKPKFVFGLGFTGKIRDAKIALSAPGLNAERGNVGFVPIVNFRFKWNIDNKFGLILEGDALAAPQGRAEDIQLAATYQQSNNIGFRAGYRILEGGAGNNSVYNFTLIHYASFGITYTFGRKSSSN